MQDAVKKLGSLLANNASKASVSVALQERLSQKQQASVVHNAVAASLLAVQPAGKKEGHALSPGACLTAAKALAQAQSGPPRAAMLLALATAQSDTAAAGVEVISSWLNGHHSADALPAVLLAAHLAATASPPHLQAAVDMLGHAKLSQQQRFAPALVATRASFLERLKHPTAAQEDAQSAVDFWRGEAGSPQRDAALCQSVEHACSLWLRCSDAEGASQLLASYLVRLHCTLCFA